jgi:hypothetical protein
MKPGYPWCWQPPLQIQDELIYKSFEYYYSGEDIQTKAWMDPEKKKMTKQQLVDTS